MRRDWFRAALKRGSILCSCALCLGTCIKYALRLASRLRSYAPTYRTYVVFSRKQIPVNLHSIFLNLSFYQSNVSSSTCASKV